MTASEPSFEREGPVLVVRMRGDIDLENADRLLRETVERAFEDGVLALVVDLSEVTFLDSAGIRTLFGLHTAMAERGRPVGVVVPHGAVIARVLTITGIPDLMVQAPTVDEVIHLVGTTAA